MGILKMILQNILYKAILLIGVLILCSSCKEQISVKEKESKVDLGQIVEELSVSIWTIYQDQDSNYWFGSNGKGVFFMMEGF